MNALETSKYLRRIPRQDGMALYHSLFGNLALLDEPGAAVLAYFQHGGTTAGARGRFSCHEPVDLVQFIDLLLHRSFLVPAGQDEYELLELDRERKKARLASGYLVRGLQLVLTNSCNSNCSYCFTKTIYDSDERASLQCAPANLKMDFTTARRAIDSLLSLAERNGHQTVFIELFGGEPLMNWALVKEVLTSYGNGAPDGVSIRYSITTNGTLITAEVADLFASCGVTVTVSIDPTAVSGTEAASRSRLHGIALLTERGNHVTFNSVISKQTIAGFDGRVLVDLAKAHKVEMIGLILALDPDFYESPANRDHAFEILWDTSRYGHRRNLPVVGYWHQIYQQIIGRQPISLVSGYKTCPATGCKLSVEPAGDVFACKCCSDRIGSVEDLGAVLQTPRYEAYSMKAYRGGEQCAFCEVEGFCSGICMGTLERRNKDGSGSERAEGNGACELYKRITRQLILETDSRDLYRLSLGASRHDLVGS